MHSLKRFYFGLILLLGPTATNAWAAGSLPFDIRQFIVQQAQSGRWGTAEFGKNLETNAIEVLMHVDSDQQIAGTAYFSVTGKLYASRCEKLTIGKWFCTEGAPFGRNAFILESK